MAIHVEHILFDIIQMEQTSSQMLLKELVALCGAFGKEAIFGGARANERQARQDTEVCLAYRVDGPNALDITKKGFPDELQGNLFSGDTCCPWGRSVPPAIHKDQAPAGRG